MPDLQRFLDAQSSSSGHSRALAELRAGRKTSHWIWWIFPQLPLGRSELAVRYAIEDVAEAEAYLRHPVLRERLLEALEAAHAHVTRDPPVPLRALMGSGIDAQKLVSSLTLFGGVARRLAASTPGVPATDLLADLAGDVLAAARAQGLSPCAPTEDALREAYG
jgi:uncharacterized protein (DUF1810 family)